MNDLQFFVELDDLLALEFARREIGDVPVTYDLGIDGGKAAIAVAGRGMEVVERLAMQAQQKNSKQNGCFKVWFQARGGNKRCSGARSAVYRFRCRWTGTRRRTC